MVLLAVAALTGYYVESLEGWTLHVDRAVGATENRGAWRDARRELETQLRSIVRAVPAKPLEELRKVPIWVHNQGVWTQCMAYHPGADWLKEHGLNPQMAKGVEVGNIRTFLDWTRQQPWMVLHELAHAYHDRFLPDGFENADVKAVWKASVDAKRYDAVLHWDGKTVRHYATTNQQEFFAEATEAYFGTNDFYPFVRAELQTHDADAFALMRRVWR